MPLLPRPGTLLARQFVPVIEKCAVSVGAGGILDFGPVFLPTITGIVCTLWSEHTPSTTKAPLAVSCFPLNQLASGELSAQLEGMHKAASFILLADFKVAERNIELPASLIVRGVMGMGTNAKGCFKEYGGLEGLLYAEHKRFTVRERHSLLGGSLACILTECLR